MPKKYLFVSVIVFTALFVGNVGSALAIENSCYFYEPLPGSTIDVKITSGGQQKTISISNQNPPSLLQKTVFATKEKRYAQNARPCQTFYVTVNNEMQILIQPEHPQLSAVFKKQHSKLTIQQRELAEETD